MSPTTKKGWTAKAVGFLAGVICLLLWASSGQAAPTVSVSMDPAIIQAGGRTVLTVRVEGVTELAEPPRIPPVAHLVIRRGGQQTNFSMINGKMSRSISYSFAIDASRAGTYSIGPVEVILSPNRIEKSAALSLQVVAPGARGNNGSVPDASRPDSAEDGMVFVRAEVSDRKVYFGEQITLKMQFYQARGYRVLETRLESPPQTQGFLREELPPQRTRTETIDGRTYQVTELVYALFPTQTGELTIGPAVLECSVEDRRRRGRRSVLDGFGVFGSRRVTLRSQPITIQVDPLPKPTPDDFTGAVGKFRLRAEVDRTELAQNEPLTLSIILEGAGNIAGVGEPRIPEIADFRTFTPAVASLTSRTDNDRIAGRKEFEVVLIPETTGSLIIPPVELSIFRPRSGSYTRLTTDSLRVEVVPGAPGSMAGGDVERVGWDLREIREETVLRPDSGLSWNSPLGWSFACAPLLVFAGGWWIRRHQGIELRDGSLLRRRRAADVYGRALRRLRVDEPDGHRQLEEVFASYIRNRFGFSVQGRPREELVTMLTERGVTTDTLTLLKRLLAELDFARFASQGLSGLSADVLADAAAAVPQVERDVAAATPVKKSSIPGVQQVTRVLLGLTWAGSGWMLGWLILLGALLGLGRPELSLAQISTENPTAGAVEEATPGAGEVPGGGLSVPQLSEGEAAVRFSEANAAYQLRNFSEARRIYREIALQGFTSPELWLNLGNAHYRMGEVGWAAYAYERGRRLDPNDPDLRGNLELATRNLQDGEAASSRFLGFLTDMLDRVSLKQSLTLVVGVWWVLALWWGLAALVRRTWMPKLGAMLGVCLLLSVAWTAAEAVREKGRPDSVVVEEVRVRSNPDPTSTVEFSLPAGTSIRTGRRTERFTEVLFSSELRGWATRSAIVSLLETLPAVTD